MIDRRSVIVAAIVVFVCSLLLRAPAATVYGWFGPDPDDSPQARLVGVGGTLLDGNAAGLLIRENTVSAPFAWKLVPLPLLLGRLSLVVDAQGPLTVAGNLTLMSSGLDADELRLSGSLGALAAAAGQRMLPVTGDVAANIDTLRVRDAQPREAEGRLFIGQLAWALGARPVLLGDFQADVTTQDNDDIVASIASLAGPIDLNGSAVLHPDRSYTLDLKMKAKPDADPMIGNLLSNLGRPDAEGYVSLRRNGSLPGPAPGANAAAVPNPADDDDEDDDS